MPHSLKDWKPESNTINRLQTNLSSKSTRQTYKGSYNVCWNPWIASVISNLIFYNSGKCFIEQTTIYSHRNNSLIIFYAKHSSGIKNIQSINVRQDIIYHPTPNNTGINILMVNRVLVIVLSGFLSNLSISLNTRVDDTTKTPTRTVCTVHDLRP